MNTFARAGRALGLPTLVLLGTLAFFPGQAALAVRVYALLVSSYVLGLGLLELRSELPFVRPLREPSRRRSSREPRPATLTRLEHDVALGVASSSDLHHRLRPRLRDLAGDLLLARHGCSLEDEPERARRLLGAQAWDLVQAERTPPRDRLARGIAVSKLADVVRSLERL
jgi:hypothetical protein